MKGKEKPQEERQVIYYVCCGNYFMHDSKKRALDTVHAEEGEDQERLKMGALQLLNALRGKPTLAKHIKKRL